MREEILRLRELGYTYSQIVNELGCAKSTVAYHIGPGQREKSRARTKKKENMYRRTIIEIKESVSCMDCGENYPYFMMDFDHRPEANKVSEVSKLSSFSSMGKLLEEIEKCDIVCANCHRLRSWLRKQKV